MKIGNLVWWKNWSQKTHETVSLNKSVYSKPKSTQHLSVFSKIIFIEGSTNADLQHYKIIFIESSINADLQDYKIIFIEGSTNANLQHYKIIFIESSTNADLQH